MCKTKIVELCNNNGQRDANDFHYSLKQWPFLNSLFHSPTIFSIFNISKTELAESELRNNLK